MKYSEGSIGRIFTIRLEDGDILPGCLEKFAREHYVKRGFCLYLGAVDQGSTVVIGPKDGREMPPEPMELKLSEVHEVVGAGTLFPDKEGNPKLHSHAALGRENTTITGCIRPGIITWKTVEIVLIEISGMYYGTRIFDPATKFSLLEPEE